MLLLYIRRWRSLFDIGLRGTLVHGTILWRVLLKVHRMVLMVLLLFKKPNVFLIKIERLVDIIADVVLGTLLGEGVVTNVGIRHEI